MYQRKACLADTSSKKYGDWHKMFKEADKAECVPVPSDHPLYILYTSGTTGAPKGVVRDTGGHAVALAWSMRAIYNTLPGEIFWAASDIGWVVGHSYIVYGPLLNGCATVLYEGKPVGTPDAGAFWRVIEEYKISTFFTAPTAMRAIRKQDPKAEHLAGYDVSSLKTLFLAGERADPDTIIWAEECLNIPVIDHWWQTELGWPAIATCVGLADTSIRRGAAGRPVPGFQFKAESREGEAVGNEVGNLLIKLPLPPGAFLTLWENDDGYKRSYFDFRSGYYLTGDASFIDDDGYVLLWGVQTT